MHSVHPSDAVGVLGLDLLEVVTLVFGVLGLELGGVGTLGEESLALL